MPKYLRLPMLFVFSAVMALPAAGQGSGSSNEEQSPPPDEVHAPPASDDEAADAADHGARHETSVRRKRSGDWQFTLSPYLWTMSLRAQADAGPLTGTSEACFLDLLGDLDGAAQVRFEGMKDRWGFYLDGTYLGLSEEAKVRTGPFRIRGLDSEMDLTEAWLDFGGIYRFGEPGRAFDILAGGRWAYISTELSLGPLDVDQSDDYLSPVIGGRFEYALSDRWLVSFKADFGGFGVADAADLVWGATGLLGYRLSEQTTVGFGYRYYDIDFGGDKMDVDLQYHGPIIGLAYSF